MTCPESLTFDLPCIFGFPTWYGRKPPIIIGGAILRPGLTLVLPTFLLEGFFIGCSIKLKLFFHDLSLLSSMTDEEKNSDTSLVVSRLFPIDPSRWGGGNFSCFVLALALVINLGTWREKKIIGNSEGLIRVSPHQSSRNRSYGNPCLITEKCTHKCTEPGWQLFLFNSNKI